MADKAPPTPTHYLGREIATTMHYLGAGWLVRESREREEECSTLIKTLNLKPGQVVCDLGCGNGFYTLRIAPKVLPGGRVLAVDIQREMLQKLRERSARYKLENIEPILGDVDEPEVEITKSPGHFTEWVDAIRGGKPARSNFVDYSGGLTETILLGVLAQREHGKQLRWDAEAMEIQGRPDLKRVYHLFYGRFDNIASILCVYDETLILKFIQRFSRRTMADIEHLYNVSFN